MIVSSLEQFCHTGFGHAVGNVVANTVAYGIDGVVAGVAIAVLGTLSLAVIASRDKDPSAKAGVPFAAIYMLGAGIQYGGAIGACFGMGKGILEQLI